MLVEVGSRGRPSGRRGREVALARTWAVALSGVAGQLVAVEADLANGLPGTTVIGLGDVAVTQARDRVRSAIVNTGQRWPDKRITLALSPAALPKRGAGFDLALAVAVLAAAEVVPLRAAGEVVLIGELGLDGRVHPVRGTLPSLLAIKAAGRVSAVVPVANLAEACLADGVRVRGVAHLADLIGYLNGEPDRLTEAPPAAASVEYPVPDMVEVLGQPEARRALELAAAGGHHMAMIGPPGAGKTMLAARLPGLLPKLSPESALEVTAVHSVAGNLDEETPLITRPPFIEPHHSASLAALVGGGSGLIRPGSVSLAHRGVLFLDESPNHKYAVNGMVHECPQSTEGRANRLGRRPIPPTRRSTRRSTLAHGPSCYTCGSPKFTSRLELTRSSASDWIFAGNSLPTGAGQSQPSTLTTTRRRRQQPVLGRAGSRSIGRSRRVKCKPLPSGSLTEQIGLPPRLLNGSQTVKSTMSRSSAMKTHPMN